VRIVFSSLARSLGAALLLLAFVLLPYFFLGAAVEGRVAALLAANGPTIALAGAILLALDIVLPVPSSVVATAVGAAAGPWLGTLANAAGLTAGCAAGLLLGRSGSPLARRILGGALFRSFEGGLARYGIVAILVCRPVPVLAEASIVAAGAGRAPLVPALAAAAVANLGVGAAYAFAGTAPPAVAAALAIGLPVLAGLCAWLWLRRSAASGLPRPSPGADAMRRGRAAARHP
jgi:uncharacterized membrane protein YdjX (TVP38/TMEM64 family)